MKSFLFLLIPVMLLGGCSDAKDGGARARMPRVEAGAPAPDLLMWKVDKKTTSISDHKGKVVILSFWKMRCKECVDSMPALDDLNKKYKDQGLTVLAVNADNFEYVPKDKVSSFIGEKKYSFDFILDEGFAVSEAYRVITLPHSVVIDKSGVIREILPGNTDWADQKNIDNVVELLKS